MKKTRITEIDRTMIVRELEKWRDGQLGSKLTWEVLERTYGYSRQALQSHIRIKAAYKLAKEALKSDITKLRAKSNEDFESIRNQVETLKAVVADYVEREKEWQKRWQRIAYNLRAKRFRVDEIDREINSIPTIKETEKILSFLDKDLPPNGRI